MRPDDTGETVSIRYPNGRQFQRASLHHQFLGMGGAVQEGEIAGGDEFGELGHEAPWTYQTGWLVSVW